jgi:hypothetical protein
LGQQIWVGDNSAIKTKSINQFHSNALGGHSGVEATYMRIKKLFQWRGLKLDVDNFVKQCQVCQHVKHERTHPAGLLQPLPMLGKTLLSISYKAYQNHRGTIASLWWWTDFLSLHISCF